MSWQNRIPWPATAAERAPEDVPDQVVHVLLGEAVQRRHRALALRRSHELAVLVAVPAAAALFPEHAGIDLVAIAGEDRWQDLKVAFARRHVLTHCDGIVDERFLAQVPSSPLKVGQRLVIRRADAEAALDDLDALVRGLAAI